MRLLIALATFERSNITRLCLENLQLIRSNPNVRIVIYDDASTQYDMPYLLKYADEVIKYEKNGGIERSRARAFRDFIHRLGDFDLLYLTDNDAIHDPLFAQYLIDLFQQQKQGGESWPIGLFNSVFHIDSIVSENSDFYLSKTCPGISQCYDRAMAKKIVDFLDCHPTIETEYGWDYKWPAILQSEFLIPKISYVEHFSRDIEERGMHSHFTGITREAYLDDLRRDSAINPSDYLVKIKSYIVDQLFPPK
jgi:hypothetical protein